MGLDGADSFEKRSLQSVHSRLSLSTMPLRTIVAMAVEQRAAAAAAAAAAAGDDTTLSSPIDDSAPRV